MDDSIEWLFLTFVISALFAYWDKGLLAYLFYILLTEIFIFLVFRISPMIRVKIVVVSLLGYFLGALLFYSSLSFYEQKEKNKLGKLVDSNLNEVIRLLT